MKHGLFEATGRRGAAAGRPGALWLQKDHAYKAFFGWATSEATATSRFFIDFRVSDITPLSVYVKPKEAFMAPSFG